MVLGDEHFESKQTPFPRNLVRSESEWEEGKQTDSNCGDAPAGHGVFGASGAMSSHLQH